jgi:hypothetical protein
MAKVGCIQRLVGLFVIIIGIILLFIFILDDITIIGIVDNIIPIGVIVLGVSLAFPEVKLPKIGNR